jgi:hypothetical protein
MGAALAPWFSYSRRPNRPVVYKRAGGFRNARCSEAVSSRKHCLRASEGRPSSGLYILNLYLKQLAGCGVRNALDSIGALRRTTGRQEPPFNDYTHKGVTD